MIDWGDIPPGSVASIYWPQVQASDVLALAAALYSTHTLSATDAHTLQCKVTGGVTYVPIPAAAGENFAGLLTVDLPTTVVTGQEFNIVVRRLGTRTITPPVVVRTPPSTHTLSSSGPSTPDDSGAKSPKGRPKPVGVPAPQEPPPPPDKTYRYVVGTFQVKVPVATAETMLLPEENTLAIMKWRLEQMAPSSRWYPVLQRYIGIVAGRVDGLGGDAGSILPSPNGVPLSVLVREHEYTGKVCEVLFDCFGDFSGFVLRTCAGEHEFASRECGIAEVVLRACKDRLRLSVFVRQERGPNGEPETERGMKIVRLAIQCC